MDTEVLKAKNTEKTEYTGRVTILPELEVNNHIPDYIQKTILEGMERIEAEIRKHEEAVRELESLYISHANFLKRYSPFVSEGDLSQIELTTAPESPEAMPPAERREKDEKSI